MRVSELDLFRFLAAVAVTLYHLHGFKYGYLGVNFFFILSGFVILWTAERRDWVSFCISRFSRLYPTFWICMGIVILYLWLTGADLPSPYQIMANATMAAGYLNADYIDGVYWTLQVELKFYFLIFLLIIARQIRHIEAWLWVWLAAGTLGDLSGVLASLTLNPYHPYFVGGCALYLVWSRGLQWRRVAMILCCAVAAVDYSLVQIDQFVSGKYVSWLPALIVSGMFILMFVLAAKWLSFSHPLWIELGAMSYPLYLLHSIIGQQHLFAMLILTYVVSFHVDRPLHRHTQAFLTTQYRRVSDGL